MALNSAIEWTDATWNPITGCSKVSPGCKNCYAERMSWRLQAMGQINYQNGFKVTIQPDALNIPLQWKRRRTVFVNSMSDLFHKDIPLTYIRKIFEVMNLADWHQYQILTKRSERLLNISSKLQWAEHIWMGVSVENKDYIYRIEHLRNSIALNKFVSLEPLLGPLPDLNLEGIDWVIVGGESGPGARLMHKDWVIDIRDQCFEWKVPFFFKQWGGFNKKKKGRTLEGQIWDQIPQTLAVGYE